VQDAAHSSLLRSARQQLHAQIAEVRETQSPELRDSQPEWFAQHYAEAGFAEKSVTFWGKAGQRSASRSAMVEATAQFHTALDQLALLPDSRERQLQELELCILRARSCSWSKPGGGGKGQAFARARQLWDELGSPSEFLQVPYGQSRYHWQRGEFDLAQPSDEDLLRLSRQRCD
jgi:predicted ATPase